MHPPNVIPDYVHPSTLIPETTIVIKGLPLGINGLWLQEFLERFIIEGNDRVISVTIITLSGTCLALTRCDSTSTCLRLRRSLHHLQAAFPTHVPSASGPAVQGIEGWP